MTRELVVQRVGDWIARLNALYGQIEVWYELLPPARNRQLLRGSILQRDEALMQQFEITPQMIETRSIIYDRNRVSFVPSALWIVGANGRVNVTTADRQYPLVDFGGREGVPSDWRIVASQLNSIHIPFTEEVFQNLVLHQAVEQTCAH